MRHVANLSPASHVFYDPYASVFLTRAWRLLLGTRLQRWLLTAVYNRLVPGMVFLVRYIVPPLLAVLAWIALRDTIRTLVG